MDPSLFRRLIEGISPRPDPWSERSMQDHDFDDFVAFTDEEIAAIAAFLNEERETARPVVPDETDTQEEEDIDWDGEDDIGQAAATPPYIIGAFKQTGLHASWDRQSQGTNDVCGFGECAETQL
jgi:hypothetical protein